MQPAQKPRILGLDYGEKRIGAAVSDPLGLTAQALPAISNKDFFQKLPEIVEKVKITKIVLGLPKNMNGTLGPAAQKVEEVCLKISVLLKIECILIDERLTTKEAERALIEAGLRRAKRKELIDSAAAVLILQTYLNKNHE